MRRDLVTSALAVIAFTVLLGLAYPLLITGISQIAFPGKSDGSLIKREGEVVGSRLLAQPWVVDTGREDEEGNAITRPDPRYFQPRPSSSGYNAAATAFSNRGPNQKEARDFYRAGLDAYLALERPFNDGLTRARVPVDAVTTSASSVDPHISEANARIQARRVAAVRRFPLTQVMRLLDDHTDGRSLGFLGEPGVNTTTLNLALDAQPDDR